MTVDWKELVADKRRRQQETIPKDWLIGCPPDTVLDVTAIPEQCGLLSERELQITNTVDVAVLLQKLHSAEWSAVEVTTAFYKRAIIAHQLVIYPYDIARVKSLIRSYLIGKLSDGDLRWPSVGPCSRVR